MKLSKKNFVIAGGGTGGHLFPGIAVMQQVINYSNLTPYFLGVKQGIEAKIVPKLGYQIKYVNISGFYGKGIIKKILAIVKIPISIFQAIWFLKSRPAFVLGVGGYSALPASVAALLLRIPFFILEQNLSFGLVNRKLGRLAKIFFTPGKTNYGWSNINALGYPLRDDIDELAAVPVYLPSKFKLLVYGGSQGARVINNKIKELLPLLAAKKIKISITHQTGERDLASLRQAAEQLKNIDYSATAFIDDMAGELEKASLVICRAGAGIFELTAAGKASILIPIKGSSGDHQQKNCDYFVQNNAAWGFDETKITAADLLKLIEELVINQPELKKRAQNARNLYKKSAAKNIAMAILKSISH